MLYILRQTGEKISFELRYLVDEWRNLTELCRERPHVLLTDGDGLSGIEEEHGEVLIVLLDSQASLPPILVESDHRLLPAHSP